jgi:hypothetical protein
LQGVLAREQMVVSATIWRVVWVIPFVGVILGVVFSGLARASSIAALDADECATSAHNVWVRPMVLAFLIAAGALVSLFVRGGVLKNRQQLIASGGGLATTLLLFAAFSVVGVGLYGWHCPPT